MNGQLPTCNGETTMTVDQALLDDAELRRLRAIEDLVATVRWFYAHFWDLAERSPTSADLRLHLGEMTAQELRTAKAAYALAVSRLRAEGAEATFTDLSVHPAGMDAVVEAVTAELAEDSWGILPESAKDFLREDTRKTLTAALPSLTAELRRDAAKAVLSAFAEQMVEMAWAAKREDAYERRDTYECAASQARFRASDVAWIDNAIASMAKTEGR